MPAPWRLVVSRGSLAVTLAASEVLALCAAVELDRVTERDVAVLLAERTRTRRPWTWAVLRHEAAGLRASDARGEMTIGDVLRRAGLVLVRAEVREEA